MSRIEHHGGKHESQATMPQKGVIHSCNHRTVWDSLGQFAFLEHCNIPSHRQDEWMQKEMEEFERYKRLGKFDNINL